MHLVPNPAPDHAFWRTARELRAVLNTLHAELDGSREARAILVELEAMQCSLEHEVQNRRRRHATHVVPLQRAAGFP